MSDDDREELLKILEAQGQQFLQNFSLPSPLPASKPTVSKPSNKAVESESSSESDEWGGVEGNSDESGDSDDDGESGSDFEQEDDDFVGDSSTRTSSAPVVVFAPGSSSTEKMHVDKALMRSFMSSKVSKLRSEPTASTSKKRRADDDDEEDERSNIQNDAMLHKLVHTKLLSGSLDPTLNLSGAERRKALEGRVLELAGGAKLGKGEQVVRSDEHRRASKRVREGLSEKKKERQKQQLEEAKNLGNYHPALKKLFEASSSGPSRKREHGMKMGVGKFKNGSLHLTREDIQKVQGGPSSRGGRSGRGGKGHRR